MISKLDSHIQILFTHKKNAPLIQKGRVMIARSSFPSLLSKKERLRSRHYRALFATTLHANSPLYNDTTYTQPTWLCVISAGRRLPIVVLGLCFAAGYYKARGRSQAGLSTSHRGGLLLTTKTHNF
jgi:hypothetical protein